MLSLLFLQLRQQHLQQQQSKQYIAVLIKIRNIKRNTTTHIRCGFIVIKSIHLVIL
jgi:hypothetical protein